MPTATFDLRDVAFLEESAPKGVVSAGVIVAALRRGPVTLLLTPGTHPARKLAELCGGLLREVRPGVWRLQIPPSR